MRPPPHTARPAKILMTVDAVGGVWRYAMDLAAALRAHGTAFVFAGLGPEPSAGQAAEAASLGKLLWLDQPLDWTAQDASELAGVAPALRRSALRENVDLLHLNLPSQAVGLDLPLPVVVVSHSCVATWFRTVRNTDCPADWAWQKHWNAVGMAAADAVVAPSRSHAALLERCYGAVPRLHVVHNGSAPSAQASREREPVVLAAGRWWDEGKNGRVLDTAARHIPWPVEMAGATRGPNGQGFSAAHARMPGSLSAPALAGRMAQAAIFCSPSLFEPFGLAALEAAGTGATLVLADIPTYRELWEGAALFADPRDPQAFAEGIGQLIADRNLRETLGETARRRVARFSLAAQAKAMLRVYAAAQPQAPAQAAG